MHKNFFLKSVLLASALLAAPCPGHSTPIGSHATPANPYTYVTHLVSTDNAAAQAEFEHGLTLVFAYQRGEGGQAFREAARLDPILAMAWWGIGLALGPDINSPPEAKTTLQAAQAMTRAQKLATARATPVERDYIQALAARYTTATEPDFDKLARAYRDSMETLARKYPGDGDADAQALFAEALMDQRPWQLCTP